MNKTESFIAVIGNKVHNGLKNIDSIDSSIFTESTWGWKIKAVASGDVDFWNKRKDSYDGEVDLNSVDVQNIIQQCKDFCNAIKHKEQEWQHT